MYSISFPEVIFCRLQILLHHMLPLPLSFTSFFPPFFFVFLSSVGGASVSRVVSVEFFLVSLWLAFGVFIYRMGCRIHRVFEVFNFLSSVLTSVLSSLFFTPPSTRLFLSLLRITDCVYYIFVFLGRFS